MNTVEDEITLEYLFCLFDEIYTDGIFCVDEFGDFKMFTVGKMTPLRHCILIPVENINVLGKQGRY